MSRASAEGGEEGKRDVLSVSSSSLLYIDIYSHQTFYPILLIQNQVMYFLQRIR